MSTSRISDEVEGDPGEDAGEGDILSADMVAFSVAGPEFGDIGNGVPARLRSAFCSSFGKPRVKAVCASEGSSEDTPG